VLQEYYRSTGIFHEYCSTGVLQECYRSIIVVQEYYISITSVMQDYYHHPSFSHRNYTNDLHRIIRITLMTYVGSYELH
jgi:hypothetical protein